MNREHDSRRGGGGWRGWHPFRDADSDVLDSLDSTLNLSTAEGRKRWHRNRGGGGGDKRIKEKAEK